MVWTDYDILSGIALPQEFLVWGSTTSIKRYPVTPENTKPSASNVHEFGIEFITFDGDDVEQLLGCHRLQLP